jgi:hypothetical protein
VSTAAPASVLVGTSGDVESVPASMNFAQPEISGPSQTQRCSERSQRTPEVNPTWLWQS